MGREGGRQPSRRARVPDVPAERRAGLARPIQYWVGLRLRLGLGLNDRLGVPGYKRYRLARGRVCGCGLCCCSRCSSSCFQDRGNGGGSTQSNV